MEPLDCIALTGGTICLGRWQRCLCTESPASQLLAGWLSHVFLISWWFKVDDLKVAASAWHNYSWEQSIWICVDLADLDLGQHHGHRRRILVGTSYPANLACLHGLLANCWRLGALGSVLKWFKHEKYGATSPSLVPVIACNQKLSNLGIQWAKSKQRKSSAKWQFEHISATDVRVNQWNCPTTSAESI